MAKRFSKLDRLIMICGRYEGVDERVAKYIADEEISIGDYVLTGGEIPAMIVVDAVSRLIPGVLGKHESLEEIKGSYPVYTRPEKFGKWSVPKVLLSGNHKKINEWRKGA
jgi:tRNA (guanine37-N1)-methyltransferase